MRVRGRIALLTIAVLLLGVAGGSALASLRASVPDAQGNIRSCYSKTGGDLRVLVQGRCKVSEKKLVWSQRVRKPRLRAVGSAGLPYAADWHPAVVAGHQDLAIYRDASQIVHLTGLACHSFGGGCDDLIVTIDANGHVFTLPAGYRPAKRLVFTAESFGNGTHYTARVDVLPTGEVKIVAPPTYGARWVSFDGVSFLTR